MTGADWLAGWETWFETAAVGMVLTAGGRCRLVNSRAALLGYGVEELLGQPAGALFPAPMPMPRSARRPPGPGAAGCHFETDTCHLPAGRQPALVRLAAAGCPDSGPGQPTLWALWDISAERGVQDALQKTMQDMRHPQHGGSASPSCATAAAPLQHSPGGTVRLQPGEMFGLSTRVWYPSDEVWRFVGDDVYADLAAGREATRDTWVAAPGRQPLLGRLASRAFDPAGPRPGRYGSSRI